MVRPNAPYHSNISGFLPFLLEGKGAGGSRCPHPFTYGCVGYNTGAGVMAERWIQREMHILVTNDDGITAPGLAALAKEMNCLGKVTVLAPDHNWSASGHVKTLDRPLRVKEQPPLEDIRMFASDGAPSDCVALAVLGLFSEKIDLVVSGINPNANLSHDVTYSGTVTAAMEAAIWGIPGIAVSLNAPENHMGALEYEPAARFAHRVAAQVIANGLPQATLLNVNVPYLPHDQIKGVLWTRQGLRVYRDALVARKDPRQAVLLDWWRRSYRCP